MRSDPEVFGAIENASSAPLVPDNVLGTIQSEHSTTFHFADDWTLIFASPPEADENIVLYSNVA